MRSRPFLHGTQLATAVHVDGVVRSLVLVNVLGADVAARERLEPRARLFLATFRGMPTANAEG